MISARCHKVSCFFSHFIYISAHLNTLVPEGVEINLVRSDGFPQLHGSSVTLLRHFQHLMKTSVKFDNYMMFSVGLHD